jgi:alpha-ribazole phosphatase
LDVYLIRHTRPDLDSHRCYGRFDVGLPRGWEDEASGLRTRLPPNPAIVTCGVQRCHLLATLLATATGSAPIVDDRLQELNFGDWEGRAWAEISRVETDAWAKDVWNRAPPNGETYAAMHARVGAAWQSLLRIDADNVVIVGTAGPLRALLTIALELPAEAFIRIHLDYGSVTRLSDSSGGWRLEFSNR